MSVKSPASRVSIDYLCQNIIQRDSEGQLRWRKRQSNYFNSKFAGRKCHIIRTNGNQRLRVMKIDYSVAQIMRHFDTMEQIEIARLEAYEKGMAHQIKIRPQQEANLEQLANVGQTT